MKQTPWPIELGSHPFGSIKKEGEQKMNQEPDTEEIIYDPEIIAEKWFENPKKYRDSILDKVKMPLNEKFDGGSVFYLWLNKKCPVGCDFCFFKSPTKAEQRSDSEITEEGIDRLVQFTEDGQMDKFVISGGGEPMMSCEKVNELTQRLKVKNLTIVTSAYWSRKKEKGDKILNNLLESTEANPNKPITTVRLSLDEFHFKRLCGGKNFEYVKNLIDWFSEHANKNPNFKFLIHTMDGDKTIDELLTELPIKEQENRGDDFNKKTTITLDNGFSFEVEYSQIFDSNPDVDLNNESNNVANADTFKDFLEKRRNGNMSISWHGDKPKGAFFLTLYDGTNIIWGATAPDIETSIYEENYQETMNKNLNDVLTLAALEKGPIYLQDLVKEVNPKAVARAVGVGLRDFYPRLMFEEDSTRLYTSIRSIQDYIRDNRFSEQQIESWPENLQNLLRLDADKLKEACLNSSYNIVSQYIDDKEISTEKLETLYKRIQLGHYNIDAEQMVDQIKQSTISPEIKEEFLNKILVAESQVA